MAMNIGGWRRGDTCVLPNGKTGEVVDVLKRDVCVRFLMDVQVGFATVKDVGYNEAWFANNQVTRTPVEEPR